MYLMTKKQPPSKAKAKAKAKQESEPKPKHEGKKNLNVWIDEQLVDALLALADRNKRTKTGQVELAVEEYLARQGCWPPPTT